MTYPYETFDNFPGYIYGRSKTPTVSVLEERLTALAQQNAEVLAGKNLYD
jgi:O-acetylhomoserine/O-acetylserine sulfhydrylase-like pyridoxal-dependent enzyme